jgi:biotin carboxylase
MTRVLVLAATTGYQTRSFGEAAERLGVELVYATDRCHLIEDPWQDQAVPIRFHDEDASVAAILDVARSKPFDGVIAVGDRPTVIAARVAHALGLPGNPPEAAAAARHKLKTRERMRDAGLLVPWFFPVAAFEDPPPSLAASSASYCGPVLSATGAQAGSQPPAPSPGIPSFPCVVKPVALSGSRGVMRADDPRSFADACERLRALLRSPEIRAERNGAHETILVEGFIPGREYAIEAILHHGALHILAIFDKPEPLDGPFFEETIYVTPSSEPSAVQERIGDAVARAARALGLHHGPVHAECRMNAEGVFVLEVAARPIGGLCARALRFVCTANGQPAPGPEPSRLRSVRSQRNFGAARRSGEAAKVAAPVALEELLLRHALGDDPTDWRRERDASGVMMIPIPRRGMLRGVEGTEAARQVAGIDDVRITAKPDQLLIPLPEGASYLGFIFARAPHAAAVGDALAAAYARLTFTIDPELPVLTAAQIHYNLQHG